MTNLEKIELTVLLQLSHVFTSREHLLKSIELKDYHGFSKARWPEHLLISALHGTNLTPTDVQVEIVRVSTDLTSEVHFHADAHALITILGSRQHLPNPVELEAYIDGNWPEVAANQRIDVPPGTHHGLRARTNKGGWFLSVQSPPIEKREGHDDYHRVQA